jgi:hypothetical protein
MPGSQRIRRRAGVRQARTIGPEWGSATQGNSVRTEFDDEVNRRLELGYVGRAMEPVTDCHR